jgi:glycosyltransferase involved in cell wall biosynthesis
MLHLVPRETGGSELYARRLVPALLERQPELQLTIFAGREAVSSLHSEPWGGDVEITEIRVNARSRPRRVLAEQTLLPPALRRARVDLLHNLFTTAPAVPPVPQVTTILDVIYKRYPETHAGLLGHGLALLAWLAARRSRRIVTLSEDAKSDIVRFLHVPTGRVDVTPLGPGLAIAGNPLPPVEARRRFDLGSAPLVLTVSAKRPHKNLARLFEAFAKLDVSEEPVLVVPGYSTVFEDELQERAEDLGLGTRVRFTGWVDDPALDGLYHAADCFVFPSLAEGFGLPVLEAMLRGVPVACSRVGALEEVAGDGALYFDPTDVGDIARAIEGLLTDEELRVRLRSAGLERAKLFSWDATAEATLACYERALRS